MLYAKEYYNKSYKYFKFRLRYLSVVDILFVHQQISNLHIFSKKTLKVFIFYFKPSKLIDSDFFFLFPLSNKLDCQFGNICSDSID